MEWTRQRRIGVSVAVVAGLLLVGTIGWYFFAPKPEETRSEAAPTGTTLFTGSFQSADSVHSVTGTISVVDTAEGPVLRFEDYDATAGPDVYVYLTPAMGRPDGADVDPAGMKVLTSSATGQATLRGDFNVDLPDDVDLMTYHSIAIWCDRFDVLFGYAELAQVAS